MTSARWVKQVSFICERTGKGLKDLAAHFIAAGAGGWANSDDNIHRLCVVVLRHARQGLGGDLSNRAAPAGVHCCKRAAFGIADQDRHAIRRFHSRHNVFRVADDGVTVNRIAARVFGGFSIVTVPNYAHAGTMHLPATRQFPIAGKQLEKAPPILQNIFCRVFIKAGEVQRIFRHGANAATTGGKAIGKPSSLEGRANQGANPFVLAPVEPGVF